MAAATVEENRCWQQAFEIANDALGKDAGEGRGKLLPQDISQAARSHEGYKALLQAACKACDERNGASRPHIAKVRRALESINKHAPTLDVIAQQQPIAAFVWGSIRFILQVTAQASAASSEIAHSISTIIRNIPRYLLELREYSLSTRVVEATSQVLARVICYLIEATRFLKQPNWKRIPRLAISTKLSRILADFENHDRALALEIRTASSQKQSVLQKGQDELMTIVTSVKSAIVSFGGSYTAVLLHTNAMWWSEFKQMEEKSARDGLRRRAVTDLQGIVEWLQRGLPVRKAILSGIPGTGEWLLSTETYRKWEQSGYHGCLSLEGSIGCGKTTLAKKLAELATTDFVLRHFFSKSERSNLPATSRFAVDILTQILRMPSLKRDPRLSSIVERTLPLTRASTSGLECSSKNLLDALTDILNIIPNYTLIVDGLDEYAGPHHRDPGDLSSLLRFLRKAGSKSETRIILLSRTGAFPEDVYSGMIRLLITNSDVNPDIIRYLEKEIEDNCYLNPDLSSLRSEIISKVPMRCQGMFLLATFLMENLKSANANEITTTLNEFPSQLTEFYQQELKTVAENLRDNEKKTQRSILLVLIGSYETFSVQTLAKILALDTEQNFDHHNSFGRTVAPVLRLCRPLAHVVNSQVQFVHESARDFLLKFVLTDGDSDEFLARKSLIQLSERKYTLINYPARLLRRNLLRNGVVEQDLEPTFEEPAFYRYACLHWQEHLTALKNPPNDILDKISQFLVGVEFVSWSETLFQLRPKSGISSQIQVKTMVTEWYERLPRNIEEKIPIQDYFVKAHETLSSIYADGGEDKLLPYLPLVRLGQYFNVGGRTDADFQRAYDYKMTVAAGFERDLGPRNPLTLRAKTEVFKEFFFQKRFSEAVLGLKEIARIQLEVTGEDFPDYFITLQLFGLALLCVTKYEKAVVTLREAAHGFRKLSGDDDLNTLVSELYEGYALAREAKLEEASKVHRNALELWLPIGGPDHPFSLMLKTALGATYRQLEKFSESEQYLLESLTARKRLFTKDNITYIDSVLQLATLYYSSGQSKESLETLGFISSSDTLKVEFERQCQVTHIRALIDIRNDKLKMAKTSLQQLVDKGSGKARDKNNRELLWARITLADLLRRCNEDDESLMVFTELVTSSTEESSISQNENQEVYGYSFPSSLADEPESPAQLAIAEKALRLVRDAKKEEAERVLRAKGLKWQRRADFWILQGGPITDTASISGLGDR